MTSDLEYVSKEYCTIEHLHEYVVTAILHKQPNLATELVTRYIHSHAHIYTIRSDTHPEMWVYMNGIYVPEGKSYIKEICKVAFGEGFTTYRANQIILNLEVLTYIDPKVFFGTIITDEIAVENGILNIFTKQLSQFTPNKRFFNKLPVRFDPKAKCHFIDKHLETVLKNPEIDKLAMYELFGFLLLKEYRYEKAFMMIGDGRNGKGKTLELMKRFLGAENCVNIPLQKVATDKFATAEFFSKLANLGGDISSQTLNDTDLFKNLTGRDIISAPRKFLTMIHFVNFCKQIFCANELPKTNDISPGFWERWVIFEFPYRFVDQKELDSLDGETKKLCKLKDPQIIDKLSTSEELSGLLNIALEGLNRLTKNKRFSNAKTMQKNKDLWILKSDSFRAWCDRNISVNYNSYILTRDLKERYGKFCSDNRLKVAKNSHIKKVLEDDYSASIDRRYLEDRNSGEKSQEYVWEGIRFKEEN